MRLRIIESGLSPELTGNLSGVDAGRPPPRLLVAGAMDRAVMRAAERDSEFVARFAAERPWLQVTKMMRIGLFAAAYEARLLGTPGCDSDAVQPPRGCSCRCPSLEPDRCFRGWQSLAALQSEMLMTDRLRGHLHRMMGAPIASVRRHPPQA